MTASTYAGNAILDCFLRGIAPTPPTAVYVSLHTADPGVSGTSEVSLAAWPAYVRLDAADGGALADAFDAAASKATENVNPLLWPANDGAGTVTVTHFGIWTHPTAGELIVSGALAVSKTLNPTDELVIYPDELDVSVT